VRVSTQIPVCPMAGIHMQGEVYLQPTSVSCALGAMTASLISVPFLSDESSLSSNDDSILSVNSRYRRAGEGVDYLGTEFKIADVTTPLPMIGNIANNGIAKTIMPAFTNTTPLLVDDVVNESIDSPNAIMKPLLVIIAQQLLSLRQQLLSFIRNLD
jgi:hypothetical protein